MGRAVVLAGASGLVGRALLQELFNDNSIAAVHTLGRRELPLQTRQMLMVVQATVGVHSSSMVPSGHRT